MRRATYNNGYAYGVLDFHCETGTNNYCKVTINKTNMLTMFLYEFDLMYDYQTKKFAKIFLRVFKSSSVAPDTNRSGAYAITNDADLKSKLSIFVDASSNIYIKRPGAYFVCALSRVLSADSVRFHNILDNLSMTGVNEIPDGTTNISVSTITFS